MKAPADFDRLARLYQSLEYLTLGPLLERTRQCFLPQLGACRRALVFGDGDGRFLARLMAQNRCLYADAVDTSTAMLSELRRRCMAATPDAAERLHTHPRDALSMLPGAQPDIVVTHFFLDCLTPAEVDQLTSQIVPHLAPGALWLVSEFRIPESGPMRVVGLLLVRSLYLIFRVLTGLRVTRLPEHDRVFRRVGLVCTAERHFLSGLLTSQLWTKRGETELPAKNFVSTR